MSSDPAAAGPGEVRHGDDLADAVAAAVRAVPGVVDLHAGTFGEVATYLPGRRVTGVRVRDDGVAVHVVLRFGVPVLDTAQRVRAAVQVLAPGPVDVSVEDVVEAVDEPAGDRADGPASPASAGRRG